MGTSRFPTHTMDWPLQTSRPYGRKNGLNYCATHKMCRMSTWLTTTNTKKWIKNRKITFWRHSQTEQTSTQRPGILRPVRVPPQRSSVLCPWKWRVHSEVSRWNPIMQCRQRQDLGHSPSRPDWYGNSTGKTSIRTRSCRRRNSCQRISYWQWHLHF